MEKQIKISTANFTKDIIYEICDLQTKNENLISKDNLDKYLDAPSSLLFTATYNEKIIGFLIAKNLLDFIDLDYILIDKNFRRQNIATNLLNELRNYCQKNNIPKILLEVRNSNTAAISFYLKNKFKQINIRKKYYSSPIEDAIILENEVET